MKQFPLLLIVSFFLGSVQAQQQITIEDIFQKGTFSPKGVSGFNSLSDGRYYCNLDEEQNLLRFAFSTGKVVDTIVKIADVKLANNGASLS
ncbi:MAG: S9 family peptidase, partial [Bacteroidetes bacterium]|nr:S9 family peptidase [Bacteroidota bacterium]